MKKLSTKIWPTIAPIIEMNIDLLSRKIEQKQMLIDAVIEDKRKEPIYQAKIDNYQDTINKYNIELTEWNNSKDALLDYSIKELEPFICSNDEILQFENLENDKLYAGRGVIYDESEDLNDN
jgi:hypothetical protein